MDRIILSGARLDVHLGVPEAERAVRQVVSADVEIVFDTRGAGVADDFRLTVDYAAVHEVVREAAQARPYALVEALAEAVAEAVLRSFAVAEVRVLIRKPEALRNRNVEWAGVEILRGRHD